MKQAPLILASGSPRRAEILTSLTLDFRIETADIDEQSLPGETPEQFVVRLALEKAGAVAAKNRGSLVIGADTAVAIDGTAIGKPVDREDARNFLRRFSGRTHEVITATAFILVSEKIRRSSLCRSGVTFHELGGEAIDLYLDTGEYKDKAGGYAIQGCGKALIKSYEGSFTNIVGFPVRELLRFIVWYGVERMPWKRH